MPYNSNDRLEREALESLVASDLSAKMKQWHDPATPPNGRGNRGNSLLWLLLLIAFGGAVWLFWPKGAGEKAPMPESKPIDAPRQQDVQPSLPPNQTPIAQKTPANTTRYLALVRSNYKSPNFATEIRGNAPAEQGLLNEARQALTEERFVDALTALQNTPTEYKTDAAYLQAHALFGLKKYAQAATLFGQLTGSMRYGEAAQWYEVLALLPDFEQTKPLVVKKLKKMVEDEGHTFQREATELYRLL